jgi:hypothetical protein
VGANAQLGCEADKNGQGRLTLAEELSAAESLVAQLRQQIASASCAEVGHEWSHIGGSNAGCCVYCYCSVPVHRCEKCGDCDYGQNAEAEEIMKRCKEDRF